MNSNSPQLTATNPLLSIIQNHQANEIPMVKINKDCVAAAGNFVISIYTGLWSRTQRPQHSNNYVWLPP